MSYINLSGTRIRDADLAELGELSDIDALDLSGTRISDAGLRHLKRLTRLAMLVLDGTDVTPAGVDDFRRALPAVAVVYARIASQRETASAEKSFSGGTALSLPIVPVASTAERC